MAVSVAHTGGLAIAVAIAAAFKRNEAEMTAVAANPGESK